jgi:hypothetical protein
MFVPSMVRRGPGITRAQGPNGQPMNQPWSALCHCGVTRPRNPRPQSKQGSARNVRTSGSRLGSH